MERYIKLLYISSIVAIVAFLGMQAYWLYSRYEYSVREFENKLIPIVSEVLDEYNLKRDINTGMPDYQYMSSYSLGKEIDEHNMIKRTIKVTARKFRPWRLLGFSSPRSLTPAEQDEASTLAMQNSSDVDSVVIRVDASHAPSEVAIWSAANAVAMEFKIPLSVSEIDSILREKGIAADIKLIKADSIVWTSELKRHSSLIGPTATATVPYSSLEKKCMALTCKIPITDILGNMLGTLVIALFVSILLTLCLIWQFKIIFRLNRIDRMRNSFLSTMIHELKRPVSTLKMCVSGLRNKKMKDNELIREELLDETKDALDLLSAYFSRMRDISFNDCSQIPLACRRIELAQLVRDTWRRVNIPTDKDVVFKTDIDNCPELFADSSHMSNMLLNLYENAVKYSGDSVTVETCSKHENDESVTISVKDNGNGIPSCDIGKIFSRFYRGEAAKTDIPGIGLGLAYVKLLVEAHGGSIKVESRTSGPDRGTCFTINFPQ